MKGYSKIKLVNSSSTTKSRSMDLSTEPITTPTIQNPISIKKPTNTITITTQHQPPKKPDDYDYDYDDDDDDYKQYSGSHHQQEQDNRNFPARIMLTRNQSVASRNNGSSRRPKIEKQNSTGSAAALQTAVKRVLSIGRSSSVSERYSRIHDQYENSIDHHEEEEEELKMGRRSENKMKKQRSRNRGGVIRACKRIFGF